MSEQNFIIDDVDLSDPNLAGWDGVGGPTIPPGEYEFEVADVEVEATAKGDGRNLKLIHRVRTEGEHYDAEVWQWLKIPGPNDKAGTRKRMAHVIRDVLGVPLLPGGGFETKALIGRRMVARIKHETDTQYDSVNNTETTKTRTKIEGERPVAGAEPAAPAPSAPSNAKPATPAPQAGRRPAAAAPTPAARRGT